MKCGAILFLILLSVLIVSCGGSPTGTGAANLGGSVATVTIQIHQGGSPTPALPGEWCGTWVTNPTPAYDAKGKVAVYAKFTQNVNGNPVGIGGATVTARVMWNSGVSDPYVATTTSDGLAVFEVSIADKTYAIGTITLVTVTFQKGGIPDCTVDQDRAAFFTLVHVSPTPTPKNTSTPGQGGVTPTATSTPTPPLGTPSSTPIGG